MSKTSSPLQKDLQETLDALVASGRCTADELGQFSAKEQELLAKATLEYLDKGESLTIKTIESSDYLFEVPNIIKFVDDPYYLGTELGFVRDEHGRIASKNRQIYDYWLTQLNDIYNSAEIYNEVLITGAIGIGKTTFMNIIQLYDLLHLMALKNPQQHYGLMPSTVIIQAFFNILMDLAADVGYTQFQHMMDSSEFFRKIMLYNTKLREGLRYTPPPKKKIAFQIGSRIAHTLGRAVFSAQMDEANFGMDTQDDRRADEKKSQVYENYVSLLRRRESRFPTAPGHFCIGSSKKSTADFLEKHIEDSKGKKGVKVIDAAQYIVKANCLDPISGKPLYSGKFFRVLLGDLTREPKVLDEQEKVADDLKDKIIKVPEEHKVAYDTNIIDALRDISGIAAMPKQAFFTNRDLIRELIKPERIIPWKYTSIGKTIPNTINLSFFGKDQIQDFLVTEGLFCDKGKLPFRRNPRFLSIDTGYSSKGDAAGIAMTCRAGVLIMEKTGANGQPERFYVPKYWTDFYIRIKGKNKEEFPLYKLTEFTKFLIREKQIDIKGFSVDGFQSVQMQQDLRIAFPSLDVRELSVDKDDSPHINLRNIVNARALDGMYTDANLLTELFDLVHISKTARGTRENLRKMIVDHPTIASDGFIGRKDVTDALTASLFLCRELDTSISNEEIEMQIEDFKKVDINDIIKKAEDEVDAAIKEIDSFKLEDLNFGDK